MTAHFSQGAVLSMVITVVLSLIVPFFLLVYYRFKKNANTSRFFIGAGIYLVIMIFQQSIYQSLESISFTKNNPWAYAIIADIALTMIWVIGIYVCLKYVLKKNVSHDNALMFGSGLAGFPAFLLGAMSVTTIINAIYVNKSGIDGYLKQVKASNASADMAKTKEAILQLANTSTAQYLTEGLLQVLSIIIQLALVLMIYYGIQKIELQKLIYVAGFLYVLYQFPSLITQKQEALGNAHTFNYLAIFLICLAITCATVFFARKIHREIRVI